MRRSAARRRRPASICRRPISTGRGAILPLNGLSEARNHLEQADCRNWLADCKQEFDLILLDPPTFSNSKRMDDTLDTQRDHVDLIHQAMRLLAQDGLLIFSTKQAPFELDPVLAKYLRWKM